MYKEEKKMYDEEIEHRRRVEDNNPMHRGIQKNPLAAFSISTAISVLAAMATVITFITSPIKDDIEQLTHRVDTNQTNVHDITKRIGSKPRAAADVAKLYGITDALQRDIQRIDGRVNGITDGPKYHPYGYGLQPKEMRNK